MTSRDFSCRGLMFILPCLVLGASNKIKETEVKMEHLHFRNIALDIVINILTCGLYNLYVQYKQCEAVNDMLKEQK